MAIINDIEKLSYVKKLGCFEQSFRLELKTDIDSEQVKKVLCFNPKAQITSSTIVENAVEVKGACSFYIGYLDSENALKKVECASEFKELVNTQLKQEGLSEKTFVSIEKAEVELSSIKMTAMLYLKLTTEISSQQVVNAIVGGQGLICQKKSVSLVKPLCSKQATAMLDEEFELGYVVGEVVCQTHSAVVTAVQCGVNSIIVDGEVFLALILLQSGEKRYIIKENRKIPFRYEIECEDAMPQNVAKACAEVKWLKTDISCDEQKNISLVKLEVAVNIFASASAVVEYELLQDAFSLTNRLEIVKESFNQDVTAEQMVITKAFTQSLELQDLPSEARLLQSVAESVEILSIEQKQESLTVCGVINGVQLFTDDEDRLFTKKTQSPFEFSLDFDSQKQAKVSAVIERADSRLVGATSIEVSARVVFTICPSHTEEIEYISQIIEKDEKQENTSPISVYIAIKGESVWDLAKRLNIPPEKIVELNKELQFPLSGEERIIIYRQLQN